MACAVSNVETRRNCLGLGVEAARGCRAEDIMMSQMTSQPLTPPAPWDFPPWALLSAWSGCTAPR